MIKYLLKVLGFFHMLLLVISRRHFLVRQCKKSLWLSLLEGTLGCFIWFFFWFVNTKLQISGMSVILNEF